MIEQQYYTRERGGLFSQTDGYDTVAKSSQLKLDYIKKNIHPLCSYDIPSELQRSGEQDETKYPPNMVIMPGASGELIVGQAVYKAKDFTGLRSTFFMHNFLLSENEKHRYIKEPEKLFGITGFKTSYDISEGRQLPTLAGIAYDNNNPYFMEQELLFGKLGISQEIFHKLIYATFIAVHSKKKIFIVLNVELEELGDMAKALLYHLYTALPWQITEKLGICTYANKVEAKKNIQITFLDQHTLRYDAKMSKDFIFDFANKKYLNIDGDIEGEFYIKMALGYSRNKMAWKKINHWAEALGETLKDKSKQNIGFYGRVVMLFEMSLCLKSGRGYDLTQPKARKGLLKEILTYLESDAADDVRKELFEVMEYAVSLMREEIGHGVLFEMEELQSILSFKLYYCHNREQEEHCIQILLQLLTTASRNKDYAYVYMVLEQAHIYAKAYSHLFEAIYNSEELRKLVIYYLINESFKEVKCLDDLIVQMAGFEEVEFILLKDRYYTQVIYDKFGGCLRNVKDLITFLEKLQKWTSSHQDKIYTNLLEEGEYYFLEHILLKNIESEKMLCQFKFSRSYQLENYEVIQGYQKLKTDLSYMSPNKIRMNGKVQELVKMFYKKEPRREYFYMLVYAFLEISKENYKPKLNLRSVLLYLKTIDLSMMLDFIIWAKGQEMYIDKSKFDKEIVSFFVELKQKGEKIDKALIEEKLGGQVKTQVLNEKVLYALKPALVKWIGIHSGVAIGVGILIVASIGGSLGVYIYQKGNTPEVKETFEMQVPNPEIVAKLIPNFNIRDEAIRRQIAHQFEQIDKNRKVTAGDGENITNEKSTKISNQ